MNRALSQTAKDANGNTDSTITFNYANLYTNNKIDITDSRGLVTYEYFKNGLLKKESYPDNKSVNYQYNNNGSITKITDPFNLMVDYQYDNRNRIDTLTVDGTKVFDYSYYGDGMLQGISYPSSLGSVSFTYDDINRLDAVTNGFGSNNSTYSYQYDKNSNVTKVINPSATMDYQYDELNRLDFITKPDNAIVELKYDSRGNRKEIQTNTRGSIDYLHKYNKDSQYKYNSLNELSEFTIRGDTYKYEYDYKGLRVKKITPQNTIKYYNDIAGRTITETDGNGNLTAQIIWGHKPLARKINGQYYYYLYNGHGDVIALIDEHGNTKNSYEYDEWGNIIEKHETIDNPLKYSGEYYDEESGLYYLRARYYEPTTGRFISKDTYEGTLTNPLSLNLYTYCYNNPIRYSDPSGNVPVETIADIASIGWSGYELVNNPSWINLGFFIWDIGATLIPYAPGSYVLKGGKMVSTADEVGEGYAKLYYRSDDIAKGTSKADDVYKFQKYKQSLVADDVLSNSDVIIEGGKLWDDKAIKALTSDGSSIDDWAKMSSKYSYDTSYGKGQYHYYKNLKTGEIHPFDAKLKLNKPPHHVIRVDMNFVPIE